MWPIPPDYLFPPRLRMPSVLARGNTRRSGRTELKATEVPVRRSFSLNPLISLRIESSHPRVAR